MSSEIRTFEKIQQLLKEKRYDEFVEYVRLPFTMKVVDVIRYVDLLLALSKQNNVL